MAHVEVDKETGVIKIKKFVAVQDQGLVINPKTCKSQIYGAMIMGIAAALYERRITDDFTYSFQLQRRWQHLGLRFGIKYGTGGIGADYFLLGDKLSLRADLFDFQRRALPNLKLQAHLNLLGLLYLGVGVDDTLNGVDGLTRQLDSFRGTPYGPAVFVGGGFTFEDDDIKLMLRALPISP